MFSCFLARAGAAALERPRVARGRSLPRRFYLCANGRVKARDWIFVCFNSFLFLIRCRSALEADAEESSRMVDLEFISRESWLEVGLQSGARVFFSRGAKSTKWAWVFRQRVASMRRRLHRSRTVFSFSHRAAILEATNLCGSRRTVVLRSAAQPRVSSPAPSACCADREAVQHEMLYVLAVRQYGKYNLLNTCSMSQCRPLAWQVQMPHLDA